MKTFLGNDRDGKPIYEGDWVLWQWKSDEFLGRAHFASGGMQNVIQLNKDFQQRRFFCFNTQVMSAEEAAIYLLEN